MIEIVAKIVKGLLESFVLRLDVLELKVVLTIFCGELGLSLVNILLEGPGLLLRSPQPLLKVMLPVDGLSLQLL